MQWNQQRRRAGDDRHPEARFQSVLESTNARGGAGGPEVAEDVAARAVAEAGVAGQAHQGVEASTEGLGGGGVVIVLVRVLVMVRMGVSA